MNGILTHRIDLSGGARLRGRLRAEAIAEATEE